MSESQTAATLRAAEIKPHLLEQWVMSDLGPDFDPQAAECAGSTTIARRDLVVSLDEKTAIQANTDPAGYAIATRPTGSARARVQTQRHPKPVRRAAGDH